LALRRRLLRATGRSGGPLPPLRAWRWQF